MAARNVSVYLTDRTFSAIRGKEAVSARLNQIVDRYLEMVQHDGPEIRSLFDDPADWRGLVDAWAMIAFEKVPSIAARLSLVRATESPKVVKLLEDLTSADFFVLVELLEAAEQAEAVAPPATHS